MNPITPSDSAESSSNLQYASPDVMPDLWIGQENIKKRLTAALMRLHEGDAPLNPSLVGRPGMGKTSLAYHVGSHVFGQDVYIFQCTQDTRAEDLIVTPVLGPDNSLFYRASPLVTAMLRGGFCILDEANRMNEKAWAALAPLLDHRRYVQSMLLGTKYQAHSEFRLVATMNEDASTYALPEFILSRLKPRLVIPFPAREELGRIILHNFQLCPREQLDEVVRRMMRAHLRENDWSMRDAITLARYLYRLSEAGEATDIEGAMVDVGISEDLGNGAPRS